MDIAILGAGNVGTALAAAATRAGHTVTVAASTPDSARQTADEAGCRAAASNAEAVAGVDVVLLAVPHAAVADVVGEVGGRLDGTVLVDSTNPLNADYSDLTTSGRSAAESLQDDVPGARVVKAFNTLFASRHQNPTEDGVPLDAFYAGDDDAAKATVAELASSLGYRPVDAGSLRMARALEEMAFLNIAMNATKGWAWQSAYKLVGPTG